MNEEREYRPFEGAIGATGAGCVTGAGALRQKEMPKAGEWWWVKYPENLKLTRVFVISVTQNILEIDTSSTSCGGHVKYVSSVHYRLSDISLVERCEDQGE